MAEPNIAESNLAHIGSDEDKAARKAAAGLEAAWKGAGSKPGVRIWRVENGRTDPGGGPDFGIAPLPREQYGSFHTGDACIVLGTSTTEEVRGGRKFKKLKHDVYLWIGSKSTQDKYAVAAYKTAELGDYFLGSRVRVRHHREVEGRESAGFLRCFPNRTIARLDGGEGGSSQRGGGFRRAEVAEFTPRLFRVYKQGTLVQALEVPCGAEALNSDDAFVLDAGGDVVYARFGATCSPFERSEAAEVARAMVVAKGGKCRVEAVDADAGEDDEGDDDAWFWDGLLEATSGMDVAAAAAEPECVPEEEEYANADTAAAVAAAKDGPERTPATRKKMMAPGVSYGQKRSTTDVKRQLQRTNNHLVKTEQCRRRYAGSKFSGRRARDCVGVTAKVSRDAAAGVGLGVVFKKQILRQKNANANRSNRSVATEERMYVARVSDDSVFAAAGLSPGYEVVSIELPTSAALTAKEVARTIRDSRGRVTLVTARQAGKKSTRGMLGLRREVDYVPISAAKGPADDAGVRFRNLAGGVVVSRIVEGSVFDETGLRLDDVIVSIKVGVDGRTAEEVANLVKENEGDVTLFVIPRCPSALRAQMRAREATDGRRKSLLRHHKGISTKKVTKYSPLV